MPGWPYNTQRWKRLRRVKLQADPLCQYCPAGRLTAAAAVDHKVPISAGGGAFDLDNLVSTCNPCHSRKTARGSEAGAVRTGKPMKGCDPNGNPLDPAHPWGGNG